MKRLILLLLLWSPLAAFGQSDSLKSVVLHQIVTKASGPNFAVVAAKIRLGVDVDFAYRQLDTLLARPYGDMFWMYGCAGLYLSTQDILRADYKKKIRECWKHFTPYRGDTENHFLMYYGSLLLMSEVWPELDGSEWFTGQSSAEIHAQAKDFLDHFIDETSRFGQSEYNSPRYDYYYVTPLVLLSQFASDSTIRTRCSMILDLFIADYAVEYLNGAYCGAHSRVSDQAAVDPRAGEVTAYGQYFFEDSVKFLEPDLAFAALGKYQCPYVIRAIAHARGTSFVNIETKRGRPTLRGTDVRQATVRKYDYMTKDYCLGSMQGGLVQPIQQQSWSLVFASYHAKNILFSLHPNFSADELAEFFPEEPSFMLERIGGVKQGYPNENKWVGGSPYERIYQNKNLLVALYDIPDSAKYHHVDVHLPSGMQDPKFGYELAPTDWTTFQYDSALVGVRLMTDYNVIDGERLRTSAGRTACWVICSSLRETTREKFNALLKPLQPVVYGDSIAYLDWNGNGVRCKRTDAVNYQPKEEWLYNSSFIKSGRGSGLIDLSTGGSMGGETLELDFNVNNIREGSYTMRH